MSWELHPAKSVFPRFAGDWDRLNARLCKSHPFFDSRFVGTLLDHFAIGNEQLCLHRKHGVITGAIILQPNGWGRWTSFRPSQAQITPVLLDDAALLPDLLKALPVFAWIIDLIAIDPRFSPNFLRPDMATVVSAQAYTIGIHAWVPFSDYWNQRPKNLKANIRRYSNRLDSEFGSLLLAKITEQSEIADSVERYGTIESAGWKRVADTAISIDNAQGAFYCDVLRRFAATGQAVAYELQFDGRVAASRLLIENNEMAVILKTTYDETLSPFSPGRIQLHRIIEERLTNHPDQTIEFYTNATRDQKEWATFGCTIQNIQIFRNLALANCFSSFKGLRQRLREFSRDQAIRDDSAKIVTLGSAADLMSHASTRNYVADFAPGNTAENSLVWFELLRNNVYQNDASVRYYYTAEGNRLTTILPLRLIEKNHIRTVSALSNFYTSLYAPMQAPDSQKFVLRHLLRAASRDHGGAHIMRFAPMDPESPIYHELMNELRAIGWIPFSFFCFGNWYLDVKGNWAAYLRERGANLRSTIKRRRREFSAAGGTLEVVNGSDGIDKVKEAIAAFEEVYSSSWKVPEPYPEFIPSLVLQLATKDMLRLGIARLQGKPIAAQIWIVAQGKASIYKLAYHEAYASYSPGTVLTSHLMQYVIEKDHPREVDYLIGDDDYKRKWMSNRRERLGIVAYNPSNFIGFTLLMKEISSRTAMHLVKGIRGTCQEFKSSITRSVIQINNSNNSPNLRAVKQEQTMAWTILPIAKFADYSSQWDALAQSRPGTPFLESAFLQPAIDVFGSGNELLCLLHGNGQLRAGDHNATVEEMHLADLPAIAASAGGIDFRR